MISLSAEKTLFLKLKRTVILVLGRYKRRVQAQHNASTKMLTHPLDYSQHSEEDLHAVALSEDDLHVA